MMKPSKIGIQLRPEPLVCVQFDSPKESTTRFIKVGERLGLESEHELSRKILYALPSGSAIGSERVEHALSKARGKLVNSERDLNCAADEELRAAKATMEESFREHAKRPGDSDFIYDVREEFGEPVEKASWDDDDIEDF